MFYTRVWDTSTRELSEKRSVVFIPVAREFFDAGSVEFGTQEYAEFEYCE